ncbi:hypothetical protein [Paractinoplanes toevensis]|uniref:Uncharacterized protein n=1 Tax=Paractinoplanes toevensis TaxID=571911 RepID=A0A919WCR2_9ACTN|nr:hypothetical protein [Actinoplanes toevensis]GIM97751.1 hypothetical protein Ato02nite_095440 [Actinoplanes toevensis]
MRWDGPVEAGAARNLLSGAPKVFTVEEWPQALNVLHVAWNRVIRRELLDVLGIGFAAGW